MAFAIHIHGEFSVDVDGTPVIGKCKILSAADRLNYSSSAAAAQDGENVEKVVRLVDQWCARVLVDCDAHIDGKTYAELGADIQTLYVEHLPMEAKEAIIKVALGLDKLTDGQEGNSNAGPRSD